MKAIVCTRYGPPEVLQLQEIAVPVPVPVPADDEVLVRICAAAVNPLDTGMIKGPLIARILSGSLRVPKYPILGADIAGRVEAVGKQVTRFRHRDEVFGGLFGGLFAAKSLGGFAEYVCATEDKLGAKPANLSYEQAAAIPVAAITALQGLRDIGQIQPGQRVLIDGASGGVGTFAIQIAKAFSAEVTAVCSTRNVDTAQSLGAEHVIDYSQQDFTQGSQRYDLRRECASFDLRLSSRAHSQRYLGHGRRRFSPNISGVRAGPALVLDRRQKIRELPGEDKYFGSPLSQRPR